MKVSELRDAIAGMEGGKVNLTIAQISEVLRCLNTITDGRFYKWLRGQWFW